MSPYGVTRLQWVNTDYGAMNYDNLFQSGLNTSQIPNSHDITTDNLQFQCKLPRISHGSCTECAYDYSSILTATCIQHPRHNWIISRHGHISGYYEDLGNLDAIYCRHECSLRTLLQTFENNNNSAPRSGLIPGLRPANEKWRYFVTSLIGWVQTYNQPCMMPRETCCHQHHKSKELIMKPTNLQDTQS